MQIAPDISSLELFHQSALVWQNGLHQTKLLARKNKKSWIKHKDPREKKTDWYESDTECCSHPLGIWKFLSSMDVRGLEAQQKVALSKRSRVPIHRSRFSTISQVYEGKKKKRKEKQL